MIGQTVVPVAEWHLHTADVGGADSKHREQRGRDVQALATLIAGAAFITTSCRSQSLCAPSAPETGQHHRVGSAPRR